MNLQSIFDALQPQTNAAAVNAANAALDSAAARPFAVVLSVDDATKAWISTILIIGAVLGIIWERRRA